jgi:hypothetical protein
MTSATNVEEFSVVTLLILREKWVLCYICLLPMKNRNSKKMGLENFALKTQ